jgi:hypothetical protein
MFKSHSFYTIINEAVYKISQKSRGSKPKSKVVNLNKNKCLQQAQINVLFLELVKI